MKAATATTLCACCDVRCVSWFAHWYRRVDVGMWRLVVSLCVRGDWVSPECTVDGVLSE